MKLTHTQQTILNTIGKRKDPLIFMSHYYAKECLELKEMGLAVVEPVDDSSFDNVSLQANLTDLGKLLYKLNNLNETN
jgi:hypothetical protein